MSKQKFTPGPWRWEINLKSKLLNLSGGNSRYDLTVLNFQRWGMNHATVNVRDEEHLLTRIDEKSDYVIPVKGREHHAEWLSTLSHPDLKLIESSPELYKSVEKLIELVRNLSKDNNHSEIDIEEKLKEHVELLKKIDE